MNDSADDVVIEFKFSVLISPFLSGMSLLVEALVLGSCLLLQDGLMNIINLQSFRAALTSSLSGIMHPAISK